MTIIEEKQIQVDESDNYECCLNELDKREYWEETTVEIILKIKLSEINVLK